MHLESFKIFCDLADTSSFTQTAKRNGVTQSAISQQLTAMERRLHGPLVNRCGSGARRSVTLTPEGQACLQRSREIIRLASEMQEQILKIKDTHIVSLDLAVCHSIALYQFPSLLRRFQQDNLATVVHSRYGNADDVYADVLESRADLGLVGFPRREPKLWTETFRRERLVLVCHPQHPLAAGPPVVFKKLKGERFIAWTEVPWSGFLNTVGSGQRHYYEPVQRFEELEAVKQAVEVDLGISILPEATVRSEVANQVLAAVPFKDDGFYEPLAVICRKSKHCSLEMESFIQSLKQPDGVDSGFEI